MLLKAVPKYFLRKTLLVLSAYVHLCVVIFTINCSFNASVSISYLFVVTLIFLKSAFVQRLLVGYLGLHIQRRMADAGTEYYQECNM